MELSEVVAMIKGEAGTTVDITVYRDREELDFTVERADIQVPTVNSKMLDDKIGYIYVMEFDEVTADQFHDALEDLKSQGMEQLVIDLRDNPGGSLDTVIQMLDEILPEGLLVYTEDKYRQPGRSNLRCGKLSFPAHDRAGQRQQCQRFGNLCRCGEGLSLGNAGGHHHLRQGYRAADL